MSFSLQQEMDVLFESKENPGVMIALYPDYSVAKQLQIKDGEDLDELHVTLLYFGKLDKLDESKFMKIMDICDVTSRKMAPMIGSFGGIGRFNASETSDGLDVFYASYDSPQLFGFRNNIMSQFRKADIQYQTKHGFSPHCTLKYIKLDESLPYKRLPNTIPSTIEYLTLSAGKTRIPFSFRGRS